MIGLAIIRASFSRNRIYLLNHFISNFGSFIFGYIYVSIWRAALGDSPETPAMVTYVMVNQSILWVSMFLSKGAFLPQKVREGTIVFDLLRPYNLMYGSFFEVAGHALYNLLFRTFPILVLGYLLLGVSLPAGERVLPFTLSVFNGFIIAFFLNYFVGLWSVKTLSAVGAQGLYYTAVNLLGGAFLPAQYYPGFLRVLMPILPFSCMNYYPASIYLGRMNYVWAFSVQAFWIILFFFLALYLTDRLSKTLQIQGG